MNNSSNKVAELEKELAYYKKQVDMLSGSILGNQYAFTQLSNVCRKYINGFHIIADIQRSYSFYSRKEVLYEQFLECIFAQMFLDRVILLEINPVKPGLRPLLWKGFDERESKELNKTVLGIPEEFLLDKRSVFVNTESTPTSFEKQVQEMLFTPNFVLTPLITNQQVWGAMLFGMQDELNTISYIPLSVSNIDMFESLAGMISAMTQQLSRREAMEKERNRIARDMHDDIGSELSKISVTCENLKEQFILEQDVIKDLSIIKESTGSIVNNIGNIIWALNPINNTLDGLLAYLREYSFEYLEIHRLSVQFDLPDITGANIISHESRTHIFMLVKETLHNIVKHAGASHVRINITIRPNKLDCTIEDNGIGFPAKTSRCPGNELRNMKQRIAETGGMLNIHSQPGKGTLVELEVPL